MGNFHYQFTHTSFSMVEFDSTGKSSLRQKSKLGDHKFVELSIMAELLAGFTVVMESEFHATHFFGNEMHFEGG